MAETLKILGQYVSTAGWQIVHTVTATAEVLSSITLCNVAPDPHIISIGIIPAADGGVVSPNSNKQYLLYQQVLQPSETLILTIGITLATGDHLNIGGDGATVGVQLYGTEIS